MRNLTRLASIAAAIALGAMGSAAQAGSLIGSKVTGTLYNPDLQTILGGPTTAIVGASSPTFPNGSILGNSAFQINITSDQLVYSPLANVTYGGGTFNGFVFEFANAPLITSVTLDASSNFTPFAISFTGNSISLNLRTNTVNTSSVAVLDIQTLSTPVPEPKAWLMALLGLTFIGGLARRRAA